MTLASNLVDEDLAVGSDLGRIFSFDEGGDSSPVSTK